MNENQSQINGSPGQPTRPPVANAQGFIPPLQGLTPYSNTVGLLLHLVLKGGMKNFQPYRSNVHAWVLHCIG